MCLQGAAEGAAAAMARAARRVRPLPAAAAAASLVTEVLVQVVVLRAKEARGSRRSDGVESETQMNRSEAST